jgi:hypothetical protein
LTHHEIDDAVALETTSATRLAIILAAAHAARTKDIGELRLDGIDPNNRRLILAGRVCPRDGRQPALVWRHHLRQDQGWLGVPGHRHRPAFPRRGGLGDHRSRHGADSPRAAGVISIAIAEPGIPHMNSHNTALKTEAQITRENRHLLRKCRLGIIF